MPLLFNKFKIESCLKKSEFSAVYIALHTFLEKRILLKTLDLSAIDDQSFKERFKQEARILASFDHPNIIRVLDFGEHENKFYISFEYYPSGTLREIINSGKLGFDQKKNILYQIASGINYAHENDVIHRDIKPENILVDEKLKVKIADFGLAQHVYSSRLTNPESVMGTPAYMAPEQIQGAKLTPKVDLFAFGLLGFELFTGNHPLLGSGAGATINNILNYNESAYTRLLGQLSEDGAILLSPLLNPNPDQRRMPENIPKTPHLSAHPAHKKANIKTSVLIVFIVVILTLALFWVLKTNKTSLGRKDKVIAENERLTEDTLKPIVKIESLSKKNAIDTPYEINSNPKSGKSNLKTENLNIVNKTGFVTIDCRPWAYVYIDSQKIDSTPLAGPIELTAGKHDLLLKHPDYPDYSLELEIKPAETVLLEIDFNDLRGYLICHVFPWAEVNLNGTIIGQTPFDNPVSINKGKYILKLENPDYSSYQQEIEINAKDTLIFTYHFNKKKIGTKVD